MKIPQITIYAKNSGLEIGLYEKRSEGRPAEGRASLRFFRLESGTAAIRFVAEPAECFELFRKIRKVFQDGGKENLNHRFEGNDGQVVTRLLLERYDRNGRLGYAISVQRGEEEINVPVTAERFLHAAEFLRHLSLIQTWIGGTVRESGEKEPAMG